jgi:hypothetical protein
MGQVGKAIADFRRATSQLSDEFNRTIQAELQETRDVVKDTRSMVTDAHASVTAAVSGIPAPTRTALPAETAPTPNGSTPTTNGTAPAESKPPLADTSQWSWETAGPSVRPAESQPPLADTSQWSWETAGPATPGVASEASTSAADAQPEQARGAPGPAPKSAVRDDLLPPY